MQSTSLALALAVGFVTLSFEAQVQGQEAPGSALGAVPGAGKALHLAVSYTHLRAHATVLDLVCRLLLEQHTP